MTTLRPDLEHKAAALAETRPTPGRPAVPTGAPADDDRGVIEALVAVTGIRDEVDDVIVPGAFTAGQRSRARTPRLVVGHDWNRICGKVLGVVELLPGDPRLPATGPDGSTWPSAAGALWVRGRFLLGTQEGREQHEIAREFGTSQGWSIGYTVNKARQRGGVRYIYDLDVYEASPVLHGANAWAHQLSVKSAGGVAPARRSLFHMVPCSVCGRPAAGTVRALPSAQKLICAACVAEVDRIGADAGRLNPADLDALDQLDELTAEQEYEQALTAEQPWRLEPDGTLVRDENAESRGRAWDRP